jgi:hypothetical protein
MTAVWVALLMLAVVLLLRRAHRGRADARRATLDTIAAELGLRVTRFDGLGGTVPSGPPSPDDPDRPLADAATAVWGEGRALHGQRNGRAVSIGALPARRYRIAIAAQCRLPREVGLWAQPRGSVLATAPPKTTTITTGDADFDTAADVAARDEAAAASLLARPAVRRALREVLAGDETVRVQDDWVYVTPYTSTVTGASDARRLLDTVTRMADTLDRGLSESH